MSKRIDFRHVSSFQMPEESPGFLLWRVSTVWRSSIEKTLKPFDLTHPQFVVLATTAWLTRNGDVVSQVDISRTVGLDPNTVSQILRGLEKKNLIERLHTVDEKRKNPVPTKKGAQLLADALPAVEKADAAFFAMLSEKESSYLLKIFQILGN